MNYIAVVLRKISDNLRKMPDILKKHKKVIIPLVVVLIAITALFNIASKSEDINNSDLSETKDVSEKVNVETLRVSKDTLTDTANYSGVIVPSSTVNVLSTISGDVNKKYYEVGERVNKESVLFDMDTEDILDSVNIAEVTAANAKNAVEKAKIALNNASHDYDVNAQLFDAGVIAKNTFDNIKTTYELAKLSLQDAENAYKVAETQLSMNRKTLQDASVKSPIKGVVLESNVNENAFLSAGTIAYVIINLDVINIEVNVTEDIINTIRLGDSVDVKIASVSEEYFKGNVINISPGANSDGTFKVKIEVLNSDNLLKSGMFAEVDFVKNYLENVLTVPVNSVLSENGQNYVYIVEDGIAKKMAVKLGFDHGDNIEILDGLSENMLVVTKGQQYVSDGLAVVDVTEVNQ
ncbi:efflux RND transporter periplasmic adaptor subunit [Anaerotignum propionicum]|uniref:RND family efflux transporter, MFP subunit n=1 Tax=Anaerotignum propionicum DSM 1682 TaxID=991789 RepID=A0A0X1U972_ANAPI|nr:efflux RND transporter periplasmic adaptor subunit [Anaerotignum propionicum]AMJ41486.1 toluene efflux pump periplasmic linker protein TtgG precursor [Anaerotignum propionicum DSM 1682]SHE69651.1 RND family efflux transporter, MFP subunit [[Clostridium] propionicum DSM 1682] [Anaerotignum propionicum DSM 1682]